MSLWQWVRRLVVPPVFVVSIDGPDVKAVRGHVKPGFLSDCADVARHRSIARGYIYGVKKSGAVSLEFSSEIPKDAHQAFRNVWGVHRGQAKRGER